MNAFSNLITNVLILFSLATPQDWPTTSELRWQLAGIAIGMVILSFGLAGLSLFFFQRKTADRSVVYFSLFSLLYAVRLIFRQSFLQSLVAAPEGFWKYSDVVIDNFHRGPVDAVSHRNGARALEEFSSLGAGVSNRLRHHALFFETLPDRRAPGGYHLPHLDRRLRRAADCLSVLLLRGTQITSSMSWFEF